MATLELPAISPPPPGHLLRGEAGDDTDATLISIWPAPDSPDKFYIAFVRTRAGGLAFDTLNDPLEWQGICECLATVADSSRRWSVLEEDTSRLTAAFGMARSNIGLIMTPGSWRLGTPGMLLLDDGERDEAALIAASLRPLCDADRLASIVATGLRCDHNHPEGTPRRAHMVAAVIDCWGGPKIESFEMAAIYALSVWPAHQAAATEWADLHLQSAQLNWLLVDPAGYVGAKVAMRPNPR